MAEDCIFCKIARGEAPSQMVQEDERTVAFMDISPWAKGHALVIPREHARNLYEISDEDLHATMSAAKRLAERMHDRLDTDGVNLLNSAEPAAWQTIFHFHVHVIPRFEGDALTPPAKPQEVDSDEIAEVAERLRG